jgi:hypothetical protein
MHIKPIWAKERMPEFPIKICNPTVRMMYIKSIVTILSKTTVPTK